MQWLRSFRRMEPISRLILMALFCSILLFSFCFQLSAAIRDGMQTRLFRLLDQQNPVIYMVSWDYDYEASQIEYMSTQDREAVEKIPHVKAASLVSLDAKFTYFPEQAFEDPLGYLSPFGEEDSETRWLTVEAAYVEPSFFKVFEYPSYQGRLPTLTDEDWAVLGVTLEQRTAWEIGEPLQRIFAEYGFRAFFSGTPDQVREERRNYQPDPLIPLNDQYPQTVLGSLVYRQEEGFLTKYDHYAYLDYGSDEDLAERIARLPKRAPTVYVTWEEFKEVYSQRTEPLLDYEPWTGPGGEGLYESKSIQEYIFKKWELFNEIPDYSIQKDIGYGFEKPYNYLFVRIDSAKHAETTVEAILKYLRPLYGDKVKAIQIDSGTRGVVAMSEESIVPLKKVSYNLAAVSLLLMLSLVTMHGFQERKNIAMKRSLGSTEAEIELEYFLQYLRLSVPANVLSVILVYLFLILVQSQFNIISNLSPDTIVTMLPLTVFLGPTCSFLPLFFILKYEPMAVVSGDKSMKWWIFDIRRDLVWATFLVVIAVVTYSSLTALKDMNVVDNQIRQAGFDRVTLESVRNTGQDNLPPVYLQIVKDLGIDAKGLAWQGTVPQASLWLEQEKFIADLSLCKGDTLSAQGLNLLHGNWIQTPQEVVLGNQLATALFGTSQLALGQTLRFQPQGSAYTVVGVVDAKADVERPNLTNPNATVFISSQANDSSIWKEVLKPLIILRSEDFNRIQDARAALQNWLNQSSVPLLKIKEKLYDLEQTRQLQKTFLYTVWMFILLEVLQISIAVLSFTLIRTRELARVVAIQRSLGATQAQIARAIFIESIWPFLPAALLGCIFGFGVFVADQGLSQVYPRDYIVTLIPIVVSMLLCILAAWQPAQRFAKIPPANLM